MAITTTSLPISLINAQESVFLLPATVCRGTIIVPFCSLGVYDVSTDFGRRMATAHGSSRGVLGVTEGGSYHAGQSVVVGIYPNSSYAVILGASGDVVPDRDANELPIDTLGFPRLGGYEYKKRFTGKIRQEELEKTPNYHNSGLIDVLNGEWAMSSPFGAAVAVEHFRAILRGAPFAKVECYGEEEPLLKLVGERLEQITMHQEYEDGKLFNTGQQINRRVLTPVEGLADDLARVLGIGGVAHGGDHTYVMAVAKTPVDEFDPPQRRFALMHEFRSYTGEYLLEAASSITLRKTCAIRGLDEVRAPLIDALSPVLNTAAKYIAVEDKPRELLVPAKDGDEADAHASLIPFARVLEYVENLGWRGRNAQNRLDKSWKMENPNKDIVGEDVDYPEPLLDNYRSDAMWHVTPRIVSVNVDGRLGTRDFYVGSSVVSLTSDGSIVLEDAYHSQIIMAKGNIRISAAKDLILESGRNTVGIAGQDLAFRGHRNIDLASNAGRVHIKAETQLNLLGGNSGSGGVLIESRSTVASPTEGDGMLQTSGGVTLLSESAVAICAPIIGITASDKDEMVGTVSIRGTRNVYVATKDMLANFGGELAMSFHGTANGGISGAACGATIGPRQTVVHGLVADTVCDLSAGGSSDSMRSVDEQAVSMPSSYSFSVSNLGEWTDPYKWDRFGFQFCTTADLGLTDPLTFMLPETSWQRHLPTSTGIGYSVWQESPVFRKYDGAPTTPFPGYTAWVADDRLVQFPQNKFYDFATGTLDETIDTEQETSLSCTLPMTTAATISANYLRGSNV